MKKYFLLLAMALTLGFVGCSNDGDEVVNDDLYNTGNDVFATSVLIDGTADLIVSIGETLELSATLIPQGVTHTSLLWSSSNSDVATVSRGVVTGQSAGEVTIYVTPADIEPGYEDSAIDSCVVTVRKAAIAAPTFEALGGNGRGRVRWVPMTSETRIKTYEIYFNGELFKSLTPEEAALSTEVVKNSSQIDVTYFIQDVGSLGEYDNGEYEVYMTCIPNNTDLADVSDTLDMIIYDQAYVSDLPGIKVDGMKWEDNVTTITWATPGDCVGIDLDYTSTVDGLASEKIREFNVLVTSLENTTSGSALEWKSLYAPGSGIDTLYADTLRTLNITNGYSRVNQVLKSDYKAFGTTYDFLGGDVEVDATYAFTQAFDGSYPLATFATGTNSNGWHSAAGATSLAVSIDLGAEYTLEEFIYWQRRWGVLYDHINLKSWRLWGTSAEAWDDENETLYEEWQQTTQPALGFYVPDFTTMAAEGKWILLAEESGQLAPGTSIAAKDDYEFYNLDGYGSGIYTSTYIFNASDTSNGGDPLFSSTLDETPFTLNQVAALGGHVYEISETTPIRFIRIELLSAWNGGSNYGMGEMDFFGEKME